MMWVRLEPGFQQIQLLLNFVDITKINKITSQKKNNNKKKTKTKKQQQQQQKNNNFVYFYNGFKKMDSVISKD